MTPQQQLLKYKMSLLQLAKQLQNIRKACQIMGVSRQHYYDLKKRFEKEGIEGLKEKPRPYPNMPNKTPNDIEKTILDYSLKYPTYGKDRVAIQMRLKGILISPSGVERIWKRNGMENRFKRLMKLEVLYREKGLVLSEEQIQALLQHVNKIPVEHVFSKYPGYLLCQDTFEVGWLKGIGKIYMQAVIDTYGSFGFAKLYTTKLPITCADILVDRVIPFYKALNIPIKRILTDNGGEYCGNKIKHDYELTLKIFDIEHKRIRVGTPQTNGFIERFNRTLLEEFFCVAFRKKGKRPIDVLLERKNFPRSLCYVNITSAASCVNPS